MDMPLEPTDLDPQETREWLDAMQAVVAHEGRPRAHYLLDQLIDQDRAGAGRYAAPNTTPYINTIPVSAQEAFPGDTGLELRLDAYLRWNAMAMVLRAGKTSGVGGHIATYASATTLYETGYRHFFRAATPEFLGDMLYIQGHSAPGIYARAYLEGRLSEDELDRFRREIGGGGLASYPHPRTMPGFWQFLPCRWAWAADGRLPGALHALPGRPRADSRAGPQGLGIPGRRRAGPARDAGRRGHGRPRSSTT